MMEMMDYVLFEIINCYKIDIKNGNKDTKLYPYTCVKSVYKTVHTELCDGKLIGRSLSQNKKQVPIMYRSPTIVSFGI